VGASHQERASQQQPAGQSKRERICCASLATGASARLAKGEHPTLAESECWPSSPPLVLLSILPARLPVRPFICLPALEAGVRPCHP